MTTHLPPRTYLLDAGNTRCKVAQLGPNGQAQWLGSLPSHAPADEWQDFFKRLGALPARALGVCVAGTCVQSTLVAALGCAVHWVSGASALAGFENHYGLPHTLGADRYVAAYGAAPHATRSDFVLATLGTATTVDWVSWDAAARVHRFEGGIIVAGLDLMLASLASGTAQLPDASQRAADALTPHTAPRSTHAALLQGAHLAQAAVVQAFAALHPQAQCFVAGGNAGRVAPHFTAPPTVLDQPALAGLARLATLSV